MILTALILGLAARLGRVISGRCRRIPDVGLDAAHCLHRFGGESRPAQRVTNVLPDPSLVPDLYLEINRPFRLYLNGRCLADAPAPSAGPAKIEDALLRQGINRLLQVCAAGAEEISLNAWFKDKLGAFLPDLRYRLTLD